MIKKKDALFIVILIIEAAFIVQLLIKNFRNVKDNLNLQLELKAQQENSTTKESLVKDLNRQVEELKAIRAELENKVVNLNQSLQALQAKMEGTKEVIDKLAQQFETQQNDIFKEVRTLSEDNKKTFTSLLEKIENLLQAKITLEKEVEKLRAGETPPPKEDNVAGSASAPVNLEKVTVQAGKQPIQIDSEHVGSVLDVDNKYNFVVIDLGEENAVKKGMKFMVLRKEKKIGEIILKEIYKGMSLAETIEDKTEGRIKRGDRLVPIR